MQQNPPLRFTTSPSLQAITISDTTSTVPRHQIKSRSPHQVPHYPLPLSARNEAFKDISISATCNKIPVEIHHINFTPSHHYLKYDFKRPKTLNQKLISSSSPSLPIQTSIWREMRLLGIYLYLRYATKLTMHPIRK